MRNLPIKKINPLDIFPYDESFRSYLTFKLLMLNRLLPMKINLNEDASRNHTIIPHISEKKNTIIEKKFSELHFIPNIDKIDTSNTKFSDFYYDIYLNELNDDNVTFIKTHLCSLTSMNMKINAFSNIQNFNGHNHYMKDTMFTFYFIKENIYIELDNNLNISNDDIEYLDNIGLFELYPIISHITNTLILTIGTNYNLKSYPLPKNTFYNSSFPNKEISKEYFNIVRHFTDIYINEDGKYVYYYNPNNTAILGYITINPIIGTTITNPYFDQHNQINNSQFDTMETDDLFYNYDNDDELPF